MSPCVVEVGRIGAGRGRVQAPGRQAKNAFAAAFGCRIVAVLQSKSAESQL